MLKKSEAPNEWTERASALSRAVARSAVYTTLESFPEDDESACSADFARLLRELEEYDPRTGAYEVTPLSLYCERPRGGVFTHGSSAVC